MNSEGIFNWDLSMNYNRWKEIKMSLPPPEGRKAEESTDGRTSISTSPSNHFCSQSSIFLEFLHLRIYRDSSSKAELPCCPWASYILQLLPSSGLTRGGTGKKLGPYQPGTVCTWTSLRSVTATYCSSCGAQAATGRRWSNECGCGPIKLYLQRQTAGRNWLVDHTFHPLNYPKPSLQQ